MLLLVLAVFLLDLAVSTVTQDCGGVQGAIPLGDDVCMQLSDPGPQQVATDQCYTLWDPPNLSLWQDREYVERVRAKLQQMNVTNVWLEVEALYSGGFYHYTFSGNSWFNTPVWGLHFNKDTPRQEDESCVSWEVPSGTYHPRRCNPLPNERSLRAVCLSSPLKQIRMEKSSCLEDFVIAPRLGKFCFKASVSDAERRWEDAARSCGDVYKGSSVIRRSFPALYSAKSSLWDGPAANTSCPVGVKRVRSGSREDVFVWTNGTHEEGQVDAASLRMLNTSGSSFKDTLGATRPGPSPELYLVDKDYKFTCLACELPLPGVGPPQLILEHSLHTYSKNLHLQIVNHRMLSSSSTVSDDPDIQCFTDSTTFYPVSLDLRKIGEGDYEVLTTEDGYYWCSGRDLFTLRTLVSDKLLVRRISSGAVTWALMIETNATVVSDMFAQTQSEQEYRISKMNLKLKRVITSWIYHLGQRIGGGIVRSRLKRVYDEGRRILLHLTARTEHLLIERNLIFDDDFYQVLYVQERVVLGLDCVEAVRVCDGDFHEGAFWTIPDSWDEDLGPPCCKRNSKHENDRDNAREVTTEDVGRDAMSLRQFSVFVAANDFHLMARSPMNVSGLHNALDVFSEVLGSGVRALSESRIEAPNVLQDLDTLLGKVELEESEFVKVVKPKVAVFVSRSNASSGNPVVGVTLSSSPQLGMRSGSGSDEKTLEPVRYDQSQSVLASSQDVDVAVLIPQSVYKRNPRLSVAIFDDDEAFILSSEKIQSKMTVNSRVISVALNYGEGSVDLGSEDFIDVIFKPLNTSTAHKQCAFWEFRSEYRGVWSTDGCDSIATTSTGLDVCRCYHLTHFAEILTGGTTVDENQQTALDIISAVGCALSLFGFLGIAVTATVFPHWRRQLGNQLLISLSTAVALNMATFLVVAAGFATEGIPCVTVGVTLHYSLMASFCWMLVSACLQYRRLVRVVGSPYTSHLLMKTSLFAWGAPTIPILILVFLDPYLYTTKTEGGMERDFCFPIGIPFYAAVLAPVALVVVVNLFVFIAILANISRCRSDLRSHVVSRHKFLARRALMGALLFFLFGLTWLFGFFASLTVVFAYLFCATATLQGLILFLFFVVGSPASRNRWSRRVSRSLDQRQTGSTATTGLTIQSSERVPLQEEVSLRRYTHTQE
uniref:Uncharacterized protein n=1 Tax=Timema tahoe TaxID=61484 RepID=A0A7R9FN06_9NEOP|nr:unnamed protein product [Timema tahoe]